MGNRIEAIKPWEEANEKKEQELNAKESDIVTREQKVMQQEAQAAQQSYGYAQQESSTYSGNRLQVAVLAAHITRIARPSGTHWAWHNQE